MNPDRMTFHSTRTRNGRWKTTCPYVSVTATAKTRSEAIQRCVTDAFKRFYELDCENRFPTQEGTHP